MKEENRLFFVPLVWKTSARRQKEGLKLIKGLPILAAVLPPQGRETRSGFTPYCHPELVSGSRYSIKGFTLIELLVVVLIIGILSAVAVPQYQKAVLKSRFSSLMPTTKSIRDGNEMYYMTNGRYADAVSKLDVTATNNADMTLTVSDDMDYAYTMSTRPSLKNNLIMYQKHSANFPGEIHCEALTGNTQAEWLCETGMHATQSIGSIINSDYTTYVLEGTGNGFPPGSDDDSLSCDKAELMGLTCSITENAQGQTVKQMCTTVGSNNYCRTKTYNEDGSYTSVSCQANSENVCTSKLYSAMYDANGNKLTQRSCGIIDNNGNCTAYGEYGNYRYTYDANGNMLTERYCSSMDSSGNCTAYHSISNYDYTYDANGNMLTQRGCYSVDNNGKCKYWVNYSYDYTYDANGNKLTERECSSMDSSGNCTEYSSGYNYTYDANGNQLSKVYCRSLDSDGNCTKYEADFSYNYTYDANGNKLTQRRCSSVDSNWNCTRYQSSSSYDYTYDANGNILTQRRCSGMDNSGNCTGYGAYESFDYTYDANGNNISMRECKTLDSNWKCTEYQRTSYDYTYDDNGKKITTQWCSGGNLNTSTGECTAYNNTNVEPN